MPRGEGGMAEAQPAPQPCPEQGHGAMGQHGEARGRAAGWNRRAWGHGARWVQALGAPCAGTLDLAGEEERASSQVLSRSQGAGLMRVLSGRVGVRRGPRAPWHRTCRVNASRRSGGTSPAPWK